MRTIDIIQPGAPIPTSLCQAEADSSLESQVELTGMLSSREQNPFPIPP